MRSFYIYGFKSRNKFNNKSLRSYDDEKRRIESWLGNYMGFRQNTSGKQVFMSIDTRITKCNPLYNALKSCSFTDGDITLHFIIFDILYCPDIYMCVTEITECIYNDYLSFFSKFKAFDQSTIRKKLNEYVSLGLLISEKIGKTMLYHRTTTINLDMQDALYFFSEIFPCGVVGSFLLDKTEKSDNIFAFKHHYINSALDSEIIYNLFDAINYKSAVNLSIVNQKGFLRYEYNIVPLEIFISVQNGRQYLLAYIPKIRRIKSFRLDYIKKIEKLYIVQNFDELRYKLDNIKKNMWGVSTQGTERIEHIEFTIQYSKYEEYIYQRLLREKRCGTVEKIDDCHCKFIADVFDSYELIPWIRTFICRITNISFSNKTVEKIFKSDLEKLYDMYDIK